jgi:hypothetical protein
VRERRFCSRGVLLSAPSAPAAQADEADEASATSCRQRSMRWVLEVAMLGGLRLSKRGFGGGYSHILRMFLLVVMLHGVEGWNMILGA